MLAHFQNSFFLSPLLHLCQSHLLPKSMIPSVSYSLVCTQLQPRPRALFDCICFFLSVPLSRSLYPAHPLRSVLYHLSSLTLLFLFILEHFSEVCRTSYFSLDISSVCRSMVSTSLILFSASEHQILHI